MCKVKDEGTLFYFAFGIGINSDIEIKKKRCAEKAYLDLCRTIKYNQNCEEQKNQFKSEVINVIIRAIENYPGKKAENDRDNTFDEWHKELCNGIKKIGDSYCDIFSGDGKNVTYGQCQKWINMTIKYMRLMGILPDKIKLKDIHIPIDNYVLNAASIKGAILESDGVEGLGVINTFVNGWSRIDCYEEYLNFQKSVLGSFLHQEKSAVEWEDEAWLAMAIREAQINEEGKL